MLDLAHLTETGWSEPTQNGSKQEMIYIITPEFLAQCKATGVTIEADNQQQINRPTSYIGNGLRLRGKTKLSPEFYTKLG